MVSERRIVEDRYAGFSMEEGEEAQAVYVIEKLQEAVNSFPESLRGGVVVRLSGEWSSLRVYGSRPETDEEIARRVKWDNEYRKESEARDRERLRELLKKYPDEVK